MKMSATFEVLLVFYWKLYLITTTTVAVDPTCECVTFVSDPSYRNGHQGSFQSPDYPLEYPSGMNCVLYEFIGNVGEIVQLSFMAFDLDMPNKNNNRCRDFLRFFTDLERTGISENDRHNYELCGDMEMIQKEHYSSDRVMILEFHSDENSGQQKGFHGRFGFINKEQFRITGVRQFGYPCRWIFQSTNTSKSGKFFSPNYPQNYPTDANCQYVFYGQPDERVLVTFENVHLQRLVGNQRCSASPDLIIVRDGNDTNSPVIVQHCDKRNNQDALSSGPDLHIDFLADGQNQRQGFAAKYRFVHKDQLVEGGLLPTSLPTSGVNDCNVIILSSRTKNGTIQSTNYPNTYPSYSTCLYTFQGQGRERVQIEFTDFDLYYTHSDKENPMNCQGVDSLTVTAPMDSKNIDLYSFCGQKKIPLLMSSGIHTSLKFTSTSDAVNVHGFAATYRFVQDFGIKTGTPDTNSVCGFIYRSDVSLNGSFTSPNYPGFYPRNTECSYTFYGDVNHRVLITFETFNVEGMPPMCTEKSQSDYIEFSNFAANIRDSKMQRYCGARKTDLIKPVESDGQFFRVTFRSNHIYDGNGFKARYEFKRYDDRGYHVTESPVFTTGGATNSDQDPSSTKQIHGNISSKLLFSRAITLLLCLCAVVYPLTLAS